MPTPLRTLACAMAAVCIGLTLAAPAEAKSKARSAKAKNPPISTYANGQSADQREKSDDARLRRECKGRPNAGACLGYTR